MYEKEFRNSKLVKAMAKTTENIIRSANNFSSKLVNKSLKGKQKLMTITPKDNVHVNAIVKKNVEFYNVENCKRRITEALE